MDFAALARAQLPYCLDAVRLTGLGTLYRGKVRDNFRRGGEILMVTTDRVSAFDRVLGTIPFKGQLLTQVAAHAFAETQDLVANHLLELPDPQVMRVRACQPVPVEMVVRGYITGSLWRDYQRGTAGAYEVPLPKGLSEHQQLPAPIVTPSTKAQVGHDQPISRRAIVAQGLCDAKLFDRMSEVVTALYLRGAERAARRGLILVDTKYELGLIDGELVLMDEVHTPDCSRYWLAQSYPQRLAAGQAPEMRDKEILRRWLLERGYQGDGPAPALPDDVRVELAAAYADLCQRLLADPPDLRPGDVHARIEHNLARFVV